jgi:peptide-methionine (R)-S-oxide reductase
MGKKVKKTDVEWKMILTPQQYEILRNKGTEVAFAGEYYNSKDEGVYHCRACGKPLFSSAAKYDSGTGWPSYYKPATEDAVTEAEDRSHGTIRTEVLCSGCDSHLGHVFDDGPEPTGHRYCINSAALAFKPAKG